MDVPEPLLRIGDRWLPGSDGTYDVINPATEEAVGPAPNASVADADAAARAAKAALPGWAAAAPEARLALMEAAAKRISERAPELVPLILAETGATARVGSRMQVPVAADRFRRYARDLHHVATVPLAPQVVDTTPLAPGGLIGAVALRQPVGVVCCITSYNFPMVNMAGKVAPALAMGNTVVVKPAPQDPLAVIELVRILDEVGFPPGVVNIVNSNSPEPAAALVEHPDVDMVSFTGSTVVGREIAKQGGYRMKRLLLELGGKGACIVLEDADVAAAVTCIGSTMSFHSGQICTAPTRAVVHRDRFDEVVDGLVNYARSLAVGPPESMDTVVGPLISAAQRQRVLAAIERGVSEGAKVVYGGGRPAHLERGYYVEPTVMIGDNSMSVTREEIFGPVVVVVRCDSEDEAVAIANDSDYGLYDYVYSRDTARAYHVARRLQAGHVGINTAQRNHEAPFGGFKSSGVGRDGGDFGLMAYSELQSIIWSA